MLVARSTHALRGAVRHRMLRIASLKSLAEPLGPIKPRMVTEEQVEHAYQMDESLRTKHDALPTTSPDQSTSVDELRRKRLIYRAKQRGWLEVDLLLGSWATENVMGLPDGELEQFEAIMREETVDVYNWLTGREEIPEDLKTPVMVRIAEFAKSSPLGRASPEAYARAKSMFTN